MEQNTTVKPRTRSKDELNAFIAGMNKHVNEVMAAIAADFKCEPKSIDIRLTKTNKTV